MTGQKRGASGAAAITPMLASLADAPLVDPMRVYEPKYDGIRAIAEIGASGTVRLWSRLGNEKTGQFPEIVEGLATWTWRRRRPLVVDGEIVALDQAGAPTGFQQLQKRIHQLDRTRPRPRGDVAFIVFDLLREGERDFRDRRWDERRAALERLMGTVPEPLARTIRLSESVRGDGRALYQRALASGWEGLIAKRVDSKYKAGMRSPDWRKLKIVHEHEFVIGGWTEPRQARTHLGALLLGVYAASKGSEDSPLAASNGRSRAKARSRPHAPSLVYVGSVGTGFDERELSRLISRLRPLEIERCPFAIEPTPNERPHWVTPAMVAQVKFSEWTADAKLRHPVYLGLRDDKSPLEIRREPGARLHGSSEQRLVRKLRAEPDPPVARTSPPTPRSRRTTAGSVTGGQQPRPRSAPLGVPVPDAALIARLCDRLRELESAGRDGRLDLGDERGVSVTNLRKVFWPSRGVTKGDLFRYYLQVAPYLLPAIADRPLVMKRFPNGVTAAPFYQHRAANVPPDVRTALVPGGAGDQTRTSGEAQLRIVGGDLLTLLYTTQLASISQDPWFSRVDSIDDADYVALDLDPAPDVTFRQVLDVARWIRDELAPLGALAIPKTSGADGVHVYVPLPPGTPYAAGLLFCEIVATVVAQKHPKQATTERAIRSRGRRVYVDYLQNVLGKTLASAYSVRATPDAGVSTPLTWAEVDEGVRREDFTIHTVPGRLRAVGDLWATLRTAKGVNLEKASRHWTRRA